MAAIVLPSRPATRQPSCLTPLSRGGIASGLVGAWMGSHAAPLFNAAGERKQLAKTGSPQLAYDKELGWHITLNGSTDFLRETGFKGANQNPLTFLVKFRATSLVASNQTIMAATASGGTSCIFQLYTSGSSLQARQFNSSDAIISGLVTGKVYTAAAVFTGTSSRTLYLIADGQIIGSVTDTSAGPSPASVNQIDIGASPWAGPGECFPGAVGTPMIFNRALSQAEILSLAQNPWQIYSAPARRLRAPALAGNRHTLTGANSAQANTSSAGAITQHHELIPAASSQGSASTTAAITQHHKLVGAASSQANTSSTAAIIERHKLAAAASAQSNTSSTGAVVQRHKLASAGAAQPSTSSAAAIAQHHKLVAANSSQPNLSSVAALGQVRHILSGASSSQANSSNVAAITQRHKLAAAATVQANLSSTGAIDQAAPPDNAPDEHQLVAGPCVQAATSTVGAITQHHRLAAAQTVQANISPGRAIVTQAFVPSALRTYRFPAEDRRFVFAPENRTIKFTA